MDAVSKIILKHGSFGSIKNGSRSCISLKLKYYNGWSSIIQVIINEIAFSVWINILSSRFGLFIIDFRGEGRKLYVDILLTILSLVLPIFTAKQYRLQREKEMSVGRKWDLTEMQSIALIRISLMKTSYIAKRESDRVE